MGFNWDLERRLRYKGYGTVRNHFVIFIELVWLLILNIGFVEVDCRFTPQNNEINSDSKSPEVLLSVSSLVTQNVDGVHMERMLELNWFNAPASLNEDPTSWVGVFNHDPGEGTNDPLEIVPTRNNENGYYRTKISFPRVEFNASELNDRCLGFWIGYINLNRLIAKSCLRAQPHWMYQMRDVIGNRTLEEIMIPGTHNSGSYEPYRPDRNTPKIRYQICQEEDIWTQLVYGNRFLDLRVAFQHVAGSREKFWISHNILRTNNTLRTVLSQVKHFLDNTNEIVIIDFHLFYLGFIDSWIDDRHKELMSTIINVLGDYMMPTSYEYSTSLNKMWKSNKRLMVGYAAPQSLESNLLFPGVFHLWGNKETRNELGEFFERNMCRYRHAGLWSAMAEMTPTTTGMLIDKYGGLRNMAQEVNSHVTRWFRDRWWNCSNMVATDFFLGNNIINVAIDANHKKWGQKGNW